MKDFAQLLTTKPKPQPNVIEEVENYLNSFVVFTNPLHPLALSLFAALTHCWEDCFTTVPFVVITGIGDTLGKSVLMETLSQVCWEPYLAANPTLAAIYRVINDRRPTLFLDETENLGRTNAGFRELINNSNRSGAQIMRASGPGYLAYNTFCPKVFALIGDTYQTLRVRSLNIEMAYGTPKRRFNRDVVREAGDEVLGRLRLEVLTRIPDIRGAYFSLITDEEDRLFFLNTRDQESWQPLFAICAALCPHRLQDLAKVATDIAAYRTRPARLAKDLQDENKRAKDFQHGKDLIRDMLIVIADDQKIFTSDLIERLRVLPTGPWRGFRSEKGIQNDRPGSMLLASLLEPLDVRPKTIWIGAKAGKGYEREQLERAVAKFSIRVVNVKVKTDEGRETAA